MEFDLKLEVQIKYVEQGKIVHEMQQQLMYISMYNALERWKMKGVAENTGGILK